MQKKNKISISLLVIIATLSGLWFFNHRSEKITEKNCINVTSQFLSWYKNNFDKINEIENNLVNTKNVDYYEVNENFASSFVEVLDSSGFVSGVFLKKVEKYIQERSDNFKIIKQNDGPPEGFDFNLILFTQEYSSFIENIPNKLVIKLQQVEGDKKIVIIDDRLVYKFDSYCKLENIGREIEKNKNIYLFP